ncbi:ABC transporter substrate-binding protein [Gaetbulibacter sp. NE]|uniref:ABC transporter substrate-binding protein n=1 Tax=Gaetbulibacter sp. NE TaxID=2982307 RepID=UPI0021D3717A|nr:helical backbone metal receptor [Gaetbulibacter sp. NE]
MIVKDQLNREIYLEKTPRRIVSLVPSQTELLVDLGLKEVIVGITKFCIHPKNLRKEKEVVGGTKQVNIDKIKKLNPGIILCNKEENTLGMVEQLKEIAPVHISDINTIEDCCQLIEMYGNLFNVQEKSSYVISKILEERSKFKATLKYSKKDKVAYFIWKEPWMVAASNTFIDFMINEAGYTNVFKNQERYPEIDLSDSDLQKADTLFLSSEPYPFKEEHVQILKEEFPKKNIEIIDGEMFSWYGSRLIRSYEYFTLLVDSAS